MKIIELNVQNLMNVRAVDITPGDTPTVVISGDNGAGKTSVLNAIMFALEGVSSRTTPRPVRDGTDGATIRVDLGDMVVTRDITPAGRSTLKVVGADGAKYQRPQALLDGLIGRLSFDPLAFGSMDGQKQLDELLALVDLPFDPKLLDRQRAEVYEDRTVIGRRVRELEGQLAGMPPAPPGTPEVEVSVRDLLGELQRRQAEKDTYDEVMRAHDDLVQRATQADDLLAELRQRVLDGEATVARLKAEVAASVDDIAGMDEPDLASVQAQLENAETINEAVRAETARITVEGKLAEACGLQRAATDRIEQIDETRRAGLAAAKFPVDGLGFDDDGVTYRGVPFRQCSAGERLRISTGMAMALNPQIRVIRITDGSLLDDASMAMLTDMASEHGFQVWIERVGRADIGVVIEDGMVAS